MAVWLHLALFCAAALVVSSGDGGSASGVIQGGKGGAGGSGGDAKGVISGGNAGTGGGSGGNAEGVIAGGDAGDGVSLLPGFLNGAGKVIVSLLDGSGRLLQPVYKFLFGSFKILSYEEVTEVIKYKCQSDVVQAAFIEYLSSSMYATHRGQLKREASVLSILSESIEVDGEVVVAKEYYYSHLKDFFSRIFNGRPSTLTEKDGFSRVAVKNILDKISFKQSARVFQQSLITNADFARTKMALDYLEQEQVDNLDAIRASAVYNQIVDYLGYRLDMTALNANLKNLYGCDGLTIVLLSFIIL